MMRRGLFLALALAVAGPAAAQTGAAANVVGERYDGYLGYAAPPQSVAVRRQTEAINIRRRALYSDFARRRGVSREEVQITAGCQLLARIAVGEAYMLSDGVWRRRLAGQPAPKPDYCG